MPPAQHPIVGLTFILFLIWLIFPDGEYQSGSLALSDLAAERLSRFHDALDVLNTSHWGDFNPAHLPRKDDDAGPSYLNLSGFRAEDNFAWEDLRRFRERSLEFSRHAIPPVAGKDLWNNGQGEAIWMNASGTVHGEWIRREGSVPRGYDSYNLTHNATDMDWIGDKTDWARNITGKAGRMMLRIDGNKTVSEYEQVVEGATPVSGGSIRSVKGTTTIEDTDGSGYSWEMRLWGVHWPHQGVILMTTTSEKFEGIFGLPHLGPSEDFFQSSQRLLNESLARTIAQKEENIYIDQTMPWTSDLENPMYTTNPSPHCEYIMYAQVHPPGQQILNIDMDDISRDTMESIIGAIESELQSPQGAPIPKVPKLQMSVVIYSPDCAFFLESKGPPDFSPSEAQHLVGMKTEVHLHQVKTWILAFALVVFAQVNLLKSQIKESCTPSTMGRVSFWTTAIMVMVDGMTFTAAATWVSSAAATFLPTLALLFSAFLSMIIGGSFLAKIWEVQLPEARSRRDRDRSPGNASNAPSSATSSAVLTPNPHVSGSLLPAPVTANRQARAPSPPIIIPSDQDIDAEIAEGATAVPNGTTAQRTSTTPQSFQTIVGRLILFSLCVIFLAISSTTWYPSLRCLFLNTCALVYLSLWIPQIHRNIIRNCRRALTWSFIVGQSVLRLLPIAYFWVKADNFLYAQPDRRAFIVFCAWVWLQLFVLAAQDIVGPRFGIPVGWTPEAWDYHPVLREDSLEAGGLPIGLVSDDSSGRDHGTVTSPTQSDDDQTKKRSSTRTMDCAICRELLEVPVISAGDEDSGVAGVFARRLYMVTPCRHIFHSACLEGWMRFRLQCPICREELPPL
ncbi:hypothetical protein EDB81DRAFT_781378 [Dactylonectria macrodidyma]|uniref:DSC E3 ubiquitin ligase complex subunit A n=1 Tax=Dactylonectria macrodidyma TaxID=307937 RepID=A0A9P9FPE8_9HYPO|nr:hypothetical protein EDB81DRAFT_781378 [Dactylonectria macrodidyma]